MQIDDAFEVHAWAPRARFALQRVPRYVHSDLPWQHTALGLATNDGVMTDVDLQVVCPLPVRVPHNQELSGSALWDALFAEALFAGAVDEDLPSLEWTIGADHSGYDFIPEFGGDTGKPLGLHAFTETYNDADTADLDIFALVDCMAVDLQLSVKGQPGAVLAEGDGGGISSTPDEPTAAHVAVRIGAAGSALWYRVATREEGQYTIERRSGGEWQLLQAVARPATERVTDESYAYGPLDLPLPVEFRLVGGQLSIRIGDIAQPYYIAEDRGIHEISAIEVRARKALSATIYAGEIFWRAEAAFTSPEADLGFASPDKPEAIFVFAGDDRTGDGYSVNLIAEESELLGPRIFYRTEISGPEDGAWKGQPWSRFAIALRAIHLRYPGATTYNLAAAVQVPPSALQVQHRFNPQTIQIESVASIVMPCNKRETMPTGEVGTWGEWALNYGQIAVEIWGSRTTPPAGMGPPVLLFSGYGNTQSHLMMAAGGGAIELRCQDRRRQLRSPRWALPWMDGWNVFYAMYTLAQGGGVAPEDMAFLPSVPAGPYEPSVDPDGEQAYFLPYGPGGSVITRHSGQPLWSIMSRIAFSIGYMLFFDVESRLQFRKFRLPLGLKRAFYESDRESALAGGGVEGLWQLQVSKDMDQVRSETVVVGIREHSRNERDQIVYRQADLGVVEDPSAFNHLGYSEPAVWMDSQFADEAFAEAASIDMHRVMRLPGLQAAGTTWFQPDVFPLDVITISSTRAGTTGLPLFVLGAVHRKAAGRPAESTLIARHFVPT
jgi:hypothetical protein